MRRIRFVLIVLTVGMLLVSCKDEKKTPVVDAETTQEMIAEQERQKEEEKREAELRERQTNSVMSKLMITPEAKTYASSAVTISLADNLMSEEGPFTVFAPSTDAFDAMSPEAKAILTNMEERTFLERTIRSHIVEGQIDSVALTENIRNGNGSYKITTLSGDVLEASKRGMEIVLKDKNGVKAVIVKSDIIGSNGVVHILDKVLCLEK